MRNIKITVAYDGTCYHGWQLQAPEHEPTIQGTLENRLATLTGEKIRVTGAGRTDAGVHAVGQTANFITGSTIPTGKFPIALNSILPLDIVVTTAEEVELDFSARFSARRKTYSYYIYNAPVPDPFKRRYSWFVPQRLDTGAMRQAALYIPGTRDFRSFCAAGSSVKHFVRTLDTCLVEQEGDLLKVTVSADGFLYNMVRIIVGTLVDVGKGKKIPAIIPQVIAEESRPGAGTTAPPQGLFLIKVEY